MMWNSVAARPRWPTDQRRLWRARTKTPKAAQETVVVLKRHSPNRKTILGKGEALHQTR